MDEQFPRRLDRVEFVADVALRSLEIVGIVLAVAFCHFLHRAHADELGRKNSGCSMQKKVVRRIAEARNARFFSFALIQTEPRLLEPLRKERKSSQGFARAKTQPVLNGKGLDFTESLFPVSIVQSGFPASLNQFFV